MPSHAPTRFAAAKQYLSTLPRGADSYPECVCKGSVVRATVAELPVLSPDEFAALPDCVRRVVADPPSPVEWTPTVHHNAVVSAVYDARFAARGMSAFETSAFEKGTRLVGGPIYRVAFAMVGVERLLHASERRWAMLHRGTRLTLETCEGGRAVEVLTYPPHLFFEIPLRSLGQSIRAALATAGASDVLIGYDTASTTTTRIELRWGRSA